MHIPKNIYIIFDSSDGPHTFLTSKEAWETYNKWKKGAKEDMYDSFWNMSSPRKFTYCRK